MRAEKEGFSQASHTHHSHDRRSFRKDYSECTLEEKLLYNLRRLNHIMHFRTEKKGGQNRILEILERNGSMVQRDLTERLGIQPGSASEILGKLEAGGMISREPCETDRRTQIVALTEQGRTQVEKTVKKRHATEEAMLDCLTFEKKQLLLSLLEELSTDWNVRFQADSFRLNDSLRIYKRSGKEI